MLFFVSLWKPQINLKGGMHIFFIGGDTPFSADMEGCRPKSSVLWLWIVKKFTEFGGGGAVRIGKKWG